MIPCHYGKLNFSEIACTNMNNIAILVYYIIHLEIHNIILLSPWMEIDSDSTSTDILIVNENHLLNLKIIRKNLRKIRIITIIRITIIIIIIIT